MAAVRRLTDLYRHAPPGGIFDFGQQAVVTALGRSFRAHNRLVPVSRGVDREPVFTECLYPASGSRPTPAALNKIMSDVKALQREMQSAGVWVFSGGLHASDSATVLRHQDGDIVLTDGPFIESKEQIGGITIVRVPDLDAALLWARKLANATTTPIEVRPFMEHPG
jgi:hypothetical protein